MSKEFSAFLLKSIHYLFTQKDLELSQIIGNLQLKDIAKDDEFSDTTARVKMAILLTPVVFSDPKVVKHRSEQRKFPGNYELPWSHTKNIYFVTVDFKFSGSPELFNFTPDGYSFTSSDTKIYQSDYDNNISIEVDVDNLNETIVLAKANDKMKTTFSLITQINPQAERWSSGKVMQIETVLKAKRKELINFYK
jgi:hypothetical protein